MGEKKTWTRALISKILYYYAFSGAEGSRPREQSPVKDAQSGKV